MQKLRPFVLVTLFAVLVLAGSQPVSADVTEAPTVPNSIIVVFHAQTLPSDAAARVQQAGGAVVASMPSVGVLVAKPVSVNGVTLIQNLRQDSAIFDADYDRVLDLIAPARLSPDGNPSVRPKTHFPHPEPTFSPALPADFFYTSSPQQWAVKRIGAQGGGVAGGTSPGAWDVTFGGGVRIAILDTGVNPAHPDVASRLIFNTTFTFDIPEAFGTPNCEVPDSANPPFDLPADQNGHGTWTSSLAAGGKGPGTGLVIGIAPDAQILNIKVLRNRPATPAELAAIGVADTPFNRCRFRGGSGLFSWTLAAILLANQQGADVISMSLGGFVPKAHNGAFYAAFVRVTNFVYNNGSVLVASAGNSAVDMDGIASFEHLPSNLPNVIGVTATTNPAVPAASCPAGTDCLASYSNFGSGLNGLAAPGGDPPAGGCAFGGSPCSPTGFVRGACSAGVPGTTTPVAAGYPATGPPPSGTSWGCFSLFSAGSNHIWYVQAIGTSASAPLLAGATALLKAANLGLDSAQIRTILQQTADDIGKVSYDEFFNHGLVNACRAVGAC